MIYAGIILPSSITSAPSFRQTVKCLLNHTNSQMTLRASLDKYDWEEHLIGLASAAHYGNNLVEFLSGKGYHVFDSQFVTL